MSKDVVPELVSCRKFCSLFVGFKIIKDYGAKKHNVAFAIHKRFVVFKFSYV